RRSCELEDRRRLDQLRPASPARVPSSRGAHLAASTVRITGVQAVDNRFPLPTGAGSDARHTDPANTFATCLLEIDGLPAGTGLALTLGRGNELVTEAIRSYAPFFVGRD